MIDEISKIQYEAMTEENKNEEGTYVPSFDKLIAEAPNEKMAAKWQEVRELIEKMKNYEICRFSGFAFDSVYMVEKNNGEYEVLQTPWHDGKGLDYIKKEYGGN